MGDYIMALNKVVAGLTVLAIVFSAFIFIDSRYALTSAVQQIESRLEQKILEDRYYALQQRIWQLEDRFAGQEMPQEVREEIRRLRSELELIKQGLGK